MKNQGRPCHIPDGMSISVHAKLQALPAEEREAICGAFGLDKGVKKTLKLADGSVLSYPKISYKVLPSLAERAGLSVKELFREQGVELKWPSGESEMLHDILCQLEEEDIRRVMELAVELTPPFWRAGSMEYREMGNTPTRRMYYISRHAPGWFADMTKSLESSGNKRLTSITACYSKAEPKEVVRFGAYLGISSLWLLGWADGETKILSPSPLAEQLACAYPFFGREVQLILMNTARLLLEKGSNDVCNEKKGASK